MKEWTLRREQAKGAINGCQQSVAQIKDIPISKDLE